MLDLRDRDENEKQKIRYWRGKKEGMKSLCKRIPPLRIDIRVVRSVCKAVFFIMFSEVLIS